MTKSKLRKGLMIACGCYLALCFVLLGAFNSLDGFAVDRWAPGSSATALSENTVLDAILAVFSAVGTWISTNVPTFFVMFYAVDTGLTFLGVLAVAGLAFSVVFLSYIGQGSSDASFESTLIAGNTL